MYLAYGQDPYPAVGKTVVSKYPLYGHLLAVVTPAPGSPPIPVAGDILSLGPKLKIGHTAIVTSSNVDANGNGSITVMEQNVESAAGGTETAKVRTWQIAPIAGDNVINWLHYPAVSPSPSPTPSSNVFLYVANYYANTVTVYDGTGTSVQRTIKFGISLPRALAVDRLGNLYVANTVSGTLYGGSVAVYSPGGASPLRTITQGINDPVALAFDRLGNLYVANATWNSSVTVYAPGSTALLRTISDGVNEPLAIVLDPAGNLYVANYGAASVTQYASGTVSMLRQITDGIDYPDALALDAAGNLYVANSMYADNDGRTVTVYASSSTSVARTITDGVYRPSALAIDKTGELYVANCKNCSTTDRAASVTVYSPNSTSKVRTISTGVVIPLALTLDEQNDLFVANNGLTPGTGTVSVYGPGDTAPTRTIVKGVSYPWALALGPALSPPVSPTPSPSPSPKFRLLYSFLGAPDGVSPYANLVAMNGILYGITAGGGSVVCPGKNPCGTVFSVTTSGAEHIVYRFQGGTDGMEPVASLLGVGGTLYGTTQQGGISGCGAGCGTVFSVSTTGEEKVLHRFAAGTDGASPFSGLISANGALYGTTSEYGLYNCGTLFTATQSGAERVLYSFGSSASDGCAPAANLLGANGMFYGTTQRGGGKGYGTVYTVDGSGTEHILYSFEGGSDGAVPYANLVAANGEFYGTTLIGGTYNLGTVFSIDTTGNEKVLYSFTGGADGRYPQGSLIAVDGKLFGTASTGGSGVCHYGGSNNSGCGVIFSVTPDGIEQVAHSFSGADGALPVAGLTNVAGTLFGTTAGGGKANFGTVFSVTP